MLCWLRSNRAAPQSDMQTRLRYIQDRCEKLEKENPGNPQIVELAYLTKYIATTVEIHLRTGEK